MDLFKIISKFVNFGISVSLPLLPTLFTFPIVLTKPNVEDLILSYVRNRKLVTIKELIYEFKIPFWKLVKILYKLLRRDLIEWRGIEIIYKSG